VLEHLATKVIGKKLVITAETGSTNEDARTLIARGEKEGTVIIASTQTNGRGRLKRKWISPEGGLYLSVILKPYTNVSRMPLITFAISLAAARTIKGIAKIPVELKWPNDLYINEKKVGGVLCERYKGAVIVGLGINLNTNISIFPASLKRTLTSVRFERGEEIDNVKFLRILLEEFDQLYSDFLKKHDRSIIEEWTSLCTMIGREVEIETERSKIKGTVRTVGASGELIVKGIDGKINKVFSADAIKVRAHEK
jgi:BirA family transcriptional regulator, biotin operon repressor / biotin---[acetyl-CoA-carboxylase] ligase